MRNYSLPDSPKKEMLIHYLKEKIKECDKKEYEYGGSQEISIQEEIWSEKKSVYREILELIR